MQFVRSVVWLQFHVCSICLGLSVVSRKKVLQLRGEKVFLLLITANSVNSLLAGKPLGQGRDVLSGCFRSPSREELAADKEQLALGKALQ